MLRNLSQADLVRSGVPDNVNLQTTFQNKSRWHLSYVASQHSLFKLCHPTGLIFDSTFSCFIKTDFRLSPPFRVPPFRVLPPFRVSLSAIAGEGKTQEGGAHRCDEETHHHSQHHGSDKPALAGVSDRLTKNGVLVITHQNADKASSTHRNNWLSLVWLRPRCFACKPSHTPFRQPMSKYPIHCSNSTPHPTLTPMPQKIQHPCRYTAQSLNSKNFFRICH